ncbi:enoyl-CoA hydratase/isomerase family protein [Sinorhizobium meliloti]|uniref:enoyl-CoA hydratase/isomerase family protein n=1 Tax=Rhizobium meliloti TaxID=382 RepID=UPI000B49E6E9|nr:enoyl-CoA hydratase/isomerase family protein [Sinorhizobium meliloti]ASP98435.1 enoyl-CoA hydratase/isomerase family protein [Sinorhizobium meliloti]MQV66180.1 enoyl-CoA hydratase/isomerase family protein [Sinorhizobium meliloti]RVQ39330.1 enoyl-CoA hydratase/isomerase family protein [Sinorhizobium meliloti]
MSKQIELSFPAPGLVRARFNNPPINLVDPDTIFELSTLIAQLEADPEIKVIVFESGDLDFFLAHYDVLVDKARTAAMSKGPTGMHPWLDVLVRLSRAPVVSIASIRGRARGAGSECALSCDIRFASAERAVLGQFEVGVGVVPGGNPMARLVGLMGRGRAIEVVLGADDFPGALAERYGYVNRAIPDAELDTFVERFARRVADFDKEAIRDAKRFIDEASLPDDNLFPPALDQFFVSAARPKTKARMMRLLQAGLQERSDVELNLGRHVASNPSKDASGEHSPA